MPETAESLGLPVEADQTPPITAIPPGTDHSRPRTGTTGCRPSLPCLVTRPGTICKPPETGGEMTSDETGTVPVDLVAGSQETRTLMFLTMTAHTTVRESLAITTRIRMRIGALQSDGIIAAITRIGEGVGVLTFDRGKELSPRASRCVWRPVQFRFWQATAPCRIRHVCRESSPQGKVLSCGICSDSGLRRHALMVQLYTTQLAGPRKPSLDFYVREK